MKRANRIVMGCLVVSLLSAGMALGQEQDRYDEGEAERFALALGVGMVDAGPGTAPYLSAAFRIRLGGEGEAEGVAAYIEPEIGYWEDDSSRGPVATKQSDLLLGVNIVGAMELARVEYFIGAGIGIHFLGADVSLGGVSIDEDDEALGVNVHFGVDVDLTDSLSLFGVGRFDIIDDDRDETTVLVEDVQGKGYLGLRFRF